MPETTTPPSPAEEAKHLAEAAKFEAEATAAAAIARLRNAEAERMEFYVAEAKRKDAEIMADDRYHHVYNFHGSVTSLTAAACIDQLSAWMRQAPEGAQLDIELIFNSPGGSVIDGMALWDYVQLVKSKGHKVTTSCYGMAASMAGILLQAGNVRVMGAESYLLIHEVSFGAGGKIGEVEDEVEFVKKIQARVVKIFADRSKLTANQIRSKWRRKDWWLDSSEALALGLIDEIR